MNELSPAPKQELARPVTAGERGLQLTSYDDMMNFARAVANSGLAPRDFKTPEACLVAMQHGLELGLSPMQALHSIAVINGRPGIYGDAALALAASRPDFEDIEETFERGDTDEKMRAVCVIKRRGRSPVVRSFSVDQAKKAQLWGKSGPWTQYPQRMLQMRARAWALRDSFPDALKGIGITEEVQDTPEKQARATLVEPEVILPTEETAEGYDAAPAEPVATDVGAATNPEATDLRGKLPSEPDLF